jgi:hypothetical protein
MRSFISIALIFIAIGVVKGQGFSETHWYSENVSDGVIIQNSLPKGGPYSGPVKRHFHYSYLVFFYRVVNENPTSIELTIDFTADSIPIPESPDTFMKLFLPADTMTLARQFSYSYGIKTLASLEEPTRFQRIIPPNGECLFYVVAVFYQTKPEARNQPRGGNRAEFFLRGRNLFYRMYPQVDDLLCGHIVDVK